ncbi:MAG: DUF3606 domain-containing protein [Comamonadaceae bacterium]|nr:MAG: DUF3606 domain-containing protein [Comamonadaceae bacterium]
MADTDTPIAPNGTEPDRIDIQSDEARAEWARKLDTTDMQLKDAVAKVGDRATDVEMHLKGTRSTTNDDRVEEAGGGA